MEYDNPFETEGNWYKGNLHIHTTNSDGDLPPSEMVAQYRKNGYDFISITDHGKITDVFELSKPDFLLIPGSEIDGGKTELGYSYHIVAINLKERVSGSQNVKAQEIIDRIIAQGGEAIIAHPYWSSLSTNDLLAVEKYIGIEIYNTSCFFSIAKGHSLIHWDDLLIRGKKVLGFATDDTHWHFNDHRPNDACGSWIMVKATVLTVESIIKAIKTGRFYASNGPRIDELNVDNEKISVRTSKAKVINFVVDSSGGESFTAQKGQLLTYVEYKLRRHERYLRIEVFDSEGQTAWTNPIFFGK